MNALLERLRVALDPEYHVERELARGGMSHVFLARDIALDRSVAVKLLRPELATAAAVARFVQESRILARLVHPNVLSVHRAGEAHGLFYYVADYMDGAVLASRLARGTMTPAAVIDLGAGLLAGLAAAYAAGIVHRDIKPSNILLAGDRPLLSDFGIAAWQGGDTAAADSDWSRGTPGYMAPEQLAGVSTTMSDIYSLALVLYEALTGSPWFAAAPLDRDRWRGVPSNLARVLGRALQPDSALRWPTALAFRTALLAARPSASKRPLAASVAALAIGLAGFTILENVAGGAAETRLTTMLFARRATTARSATAQETAAPANGAVSLPGVVLAGNAPQPAFAERTRADTPAPADARPDAGGNPPDHASVCPLQR